MECKDCPAFNNICEFGAKEDSWCVKFLESLDLYVNNKNKNNSEQRFCSYCGKSI